VTVGIIIYSGFDKNLAYKFGNTFGRKHKAWCQDNPNLTRREKGHHLLDSWRSEFGSAASLDAMLRALLKLDEATALREKVAVLIQNQTETTSGASSAAAEKEEPSTSSENKEVPTNRQLKGLLLKEIPKQNNKDLDRELAILLSLDSEYEDYLHYNPHISKKIKLLGMWSDRNGTGATVEAMVTLLKGDEAFTAILQKIEKLS